MSELRETIRRALCLGAAPTSDFELNPELNLANRPALRDAAVLVAIRDLGGDPEILLTKRSAKLKHHPGQIAFPGGKIDPSDTGIVGAALREAQEEVGLTPDKVDVIGTLSPHETVTKFQVTPVVGMIGTPFSPTAEIGEVAEIFWVPLKHALDLDNYLIQSRYWKGDKRYYYTVPWGPYYIWGATARILRTLAERLDRL